MIEGIVLLAVAFFCLAAGIACERLERSVVFKAGWDDGYSAGVQAAYERMKAAKYRGREDD